jgi:hypothetical protein
MRVTVQGAKRFALMPAYFIGVGIYFIVVRHSNRLYAAIIIAISLLAVAAHILLSRNSRRNAYISVSEDSFLLGTMALGFWLDNKHGPFALILTVFWLLSMPRTIRKISEIRKKLPENSSVPRTEPTHNGSSQNA